MAVRNVAHPSVDDRMATGGQARERTPPSGHAGWVPAADRPNPVALLEEAARNSGFSKADTREATMASVRAYREAMASFAQMRTMDIWYAHLDEDELKASIRSTVAGTAGGEKGAKKARHGEGTEETAEAGGEAG